MIDQAADHAHQTWSLALDIGIVRTREHVHALTARLRDHRRTPEVADLLDQLHDHEHA